MTSDDWNILVRFFPKNWQENASKYGAYSRKLRGFDSEEHLLRTLLVHLACGYSLRETTVRAEATKLAKISDVALLKRLKASKDWFKIMCLSLLREQDIRVPATKQIEFRLFDATTVKEPGRIGSLWRIHFSLKIPSLLCDFFEIVPGKGKGTGETFLRYPVHPGDYIIADRGFCIFDGINHIYTNRAFALVRINQQDLHFVTYSGKHFPLLGNLRSIGSRTAKQWKIAVASGKKQIFGRICAIKRPKNEIKRAQDALRRKASRKQQSLQESTLEYEKYIFVFTPFPEELFSAGEILEWYRARWQIELIFKRLKSIAQLGHLPKHDDDSSQAWLYGKLFIALLIQKITAHAKNISPWGYCLDEKTTSKSMA